MHNKLWLTILIPFAAAIAPAQDKLADASAVLAKANTLTADVKVIQVGGSSSSLKISLSKPNLARIETSTSLTVADGANITVLNKGTKVYTKQAQTEAGLKALLAGEELRPWASFFDANALAKSPRVTTRTPNAAAIALDPAGKQTLTLFIDPADQMIRKATIEKAGSTRIIEAPNLAVGGPAPATLFAFNPPAGSKEMTAEEMNSDKWFTSLAEAKAMAQKTGKLIFVDFMAEWCGPCKQLEADVFKTDRFKKLSSRFVFLKIDVDVQKDVAAAYKIEAMPTQMVLDSKGSVVRQTVGYGGPEPFYRFLEG